MLFTKMHGLGNNYVFFNLLENPGEGMDWHELAKEVSDVNYGIGSDGIILICPSDVADFRMRIFNADGSEGKNCGNGLRCTARYLVDHGYAGLSPFTIETLGGIVKVEVLPEDSRNQTERQVRVDMGVPGLLKGDVPMQGNPRTMTINEPFEIDGRIFHMTCLSMGNPHAIIFVDDVDAFPLTVWGPKIEWAEQFPERVNVGIVRVLNERELQYRVWERGSGITMACGTGACAAVVASVLNNYIKMDTPVTVHLPGGDLNIVWDSQGHVWKTGPASYVCSGVLQLLMKIAP
jgi:diaminopimelate epimerase